MKVTACLMNLEESTRLVSIMFTCVQNSTKILGNLLFENISKSLLSLDILMLFLPLSVMKRNVTNFFKNLILCIYLCFYLRKDDSNFLLFYVLVKKSNEKFFLQFIGSLHLPYSIHVGVYLDQKKEKLILLALLFTKLLKYPLQKSSPMN